MSEATTAPVCYIHPDRQTYLACSECGRSICGDCSYEAPVGQKCPECVRAAGKQRIVNARNLNRGPSFQTSPVVFSLITVNVIIFLAGLASPELRANLVDNFGAVACRVVIGDDVFRCGDIPASTLALDSVDIIGIQIGEWWRGLTSAFLHGGVMHILFNMYFLYIFGPRLEQQVGSITFSGLYLASAAGGSVASYLFAPEYQLGVGASGALFGLFGAWLYAAYRQRGSAAGNAMFNQLGGILLLNMALPFFLPNIDWRAHAGGLIAGVVVAFLWEQLAAGRPNARALRIGISYAVLALLMALLIVL
jgi:membrane associated rhomboid family serine protease